MRDTISASYLQMQSELHKNPEYGVASLGYGPLVKETLEKIGGRSISDYGAGKCKLREALAGAGLTDYDYYPYDPVFPEYGPPRPADLVCCIDVLEHIEEDYVDAVVEDLKAITVNHGLFSVATGPAKKVLADGRNAHLIQRTSGWWLAKFVPDFDVVRLVTGKHGFWIIVRPAPGL